MAVREGYKQTEVGVIPEDWNLFLIQKLIDEKIIIDHMDGNHGELYPRSHEFKQYGVPYIAANNLINGRVDFKGCKFLSKNRALSFRKGVAKDGDVLFAHNATVGPVALLRTALGFVILSTTTTYFRCDQERLINSYLLYCLQAPFFVRQYSAVMSQSTRNQVPITTQRKFILLLPPTKAEQTAIANALSDVDALIQSLSALIAKKRLIKQGAMQTLLNPYDEDGQLKDGWVLKKLGDVVDKFIGGGTPSRSIKKYWGNDIPWVTVKDFATFSSDAAQESITFEGLKNSASHLIPSGTIITSTRMALGKAVVYDVDVCINQDMKAIFPTKDIVMKYMLCWFEKNERAIADLGSGSTVMGLSLDELKKIDFPKPPINEQESIATILSDMDTEITALESKLKKAKAIKQGMMQNLLTGHIRLIQPEAVQGA